MGIKVKARPQETIQALYRRLKKMCEREGLLRELKRTAYYEKPSEKRRRRRMKSERIMQDASMAATMPQS